MVSTAPLGTSGREFPQPRRTFNASSTLGLLGGLGPPRRMVADISTSQFVAFRFLLLWQEDIYWAIFTMSRFATWGWELNAANLTVGIRSRDASHCVRASHCVHQLCIPHYPQSNAPSPSFPIKIGWRQRARERYTAIKKSSLHSAIISQAPKKSAPVSKKRSTFSAGQGYTRTLIDYTRTRSRAGMTPGPTGTGLITGITGYCAGHGSNHGF